MNIKQTFQTLTTGKRKYFFYGAIVLVIIIAFIMSRGKKASSTGLVTPTVLSNEYADVTGGGGVSDSGGLSMSEVDMMIGSALDRAEVGYQQNLAESLTRQQQQYQQQYNDLLMISNAQYDDYNQQIAGLQSRYLNEIDMLNLRIGDYQQRLDNFSVSQYEQQRQSSTGSSSSSYSAPTYTVTNTRTGDSTPIQQAIQNDQGWYSIPTDGSKNNVVKITIPKTTTSSSSSSSSSKTVNADNERKYLQGIINNPNSTQGNKIWAQNELKKYS